MILSEANKGNTVFMSLFPEQCAYPQMGDFLHSKREVDTHSRTHAHKICFKFIDEKHILHCYDQIISNTYLVAETFY